MLQIFTILQSKPVLLTQFAATCCRGRYYPPATERSEEVPLGKSDLQSRALSEAKKSPWGKLCERDEEQCCSRSSQQRAHCSTMLLTQFAVTGSQQQVRSLAGLLTQFAATVALFCNAAHIVRSNRFVATALSQLILELSLNVINENNIIRY